MGRILSQALVAASAVTTISASPAWSQGPYPCGPYMMSWGGGGYGTILGPIFMIIVLALAVAIGVLLVRWLGGPWFAPSPPRGPTALEILKERYARGEIDKEEYEERSRVLGK
jgi:putative membrane protein